jgi:hypothetical protein
LWVVGFFSGTPMLVHDTISRQSVSTVLGATTCPVEMRRPGIAAGPARVEVARDLRSIVFLPSLAQRTGFDP